ncbi:MAG: hypothetical protein MRY83_14095 [Flavobacteriales bacterium]|nr:hypothetical protein [Flavobacteriales bacterium]
MKNWKIILCAVLFSHALHGQTPEIFAKSHSGKFNPSEKFEDRLGGPAIPFVLDSVIIIDTMAIEIRHGSIHHDEVVRDTVYNHSYYHNPEILKSQLEELYPEVKFVYPDKASIQKRHRGVQKTYFFSWVSLTFLLLFAAQSVKKSHCKR